MDENMFWFCLWVAVLCSITAMVLGGMTIYTHHIREMADRGYVEQVVPGKVEAIWVKP